LISQGNCSNSFSKDGEYFSSSEYDQFFISRVNNYWHLFSSIFENIRDVKSIFFPDRKYQKNKSMTNSKKLSLPQRIKVRLDYKTTLIISRLASFKIWKKRYPAAEIIR
jgi:hypothetical protein